MLLRGGGGGGQLSGGVVIYNVVNSVEILFLNCLKNFIILKLQLGCSRELHHCNFSFQIVRGRGTNSLFSESLSMRASIIHLSRDNDNNTNDNNNNTNN